MTRRTAQPRADFEVAEPVGLDEHRMALARRAAWRLEDAPAEVIIRWAARTFGSRLALTSSMADAVLIDLFARNAPGTDVVFLDTGYHFAETIIMRDAVAATYRGPAQHGHRRARRRPSPSRTPAGPRPVREQPRPVLRPAQGRAAGPCARRLRRVGVSGLRRDDSIARSITQVVDWDRRNGKVKVNPHRPLDPGPTSTPTSSRTTSSSTRC